jgi:hypothetical protein
MPNWLQPIAETEPWFPSKSLPGTSTSAKVIELPFRARSSPAFEAVADIMQSP